MSKKYGGVDVKTLKEACTEGEEIKDHREKKGIKVEDRLKREALRITTVRRWKGGFCTEGREKIQWVLAQKTAEGGVHVTRRGVKARKSSLCKSVPSR